MSEVGGLRTVLVVDDEPDLCEIVRRMLDGRGFAVLTAGGVGAARARCGSHTGPIDLLVTDVRMPDGSGPDLADEVRRAHPTMAVLYMSGLPSHVGEVVELTGAGERVLGKPFTPTELLAAVDTLLPATG